MREKTYRRLLFLLLSGIVCLIFESLNFETGIKQNNENLASVRGEEIFPSLAMEQQNHLYVYPSGEPIGIYVKTDGVMVIGVTAVQGADGVRISPCQGKVLQGDYIMAVNEKDISSKREMIEQVQKCNGKSINVKIRRGSVEFVEKIQPVFGMNHKYLIGLWVKDDISGIGTMTYETTESFGALGHSINDNDTGNLFHISDGAIYRAEIINIQKPSQKMPGRLEGVIDYTSKNMVGRVENNEEYGIQGQLVESKKNRKRAEAELVEVADKKDIHTGLAYLLSSVSGQRRKYEVQVVDLNFDGNDSKGIELKVVDEQLLQLTGGIVQGMSGTPILQDGKLIGAVTHVFVNDATKGYGIFIEDMMGE